MFFHSFLIFIRQPYGGPLFAGFVGCVSYFQTRVNSFTDDNFRWMDEQSISIQIHFPFKEVNARCYDNFMENDS